MQRGDEGGYEGGGRIEIGGTLERERSEARSILANWSMRLNVVPRRWAW